MASNHIFCTQHQKTIETRNKPFDSGREMINAIRHLESNMTKGEDLYSLRYASALGLKMSKEVEDHQARIYALNEKLKSCEGNRDENLRVAKAFYFQCEIVLPLIKRLSSFRIKWAREWIERHNRLEEDLFGPC